MFFYNVLEPRDEDIKYHFSGHETFPFRYTWLPKSVQKVQEYPDLFARDDAIVILGVGKNMVSSMRHWSHTLTLVESPERGKYQATPLGFALFGENGWDPYLENPGTLWLLHWLLTSRWDRASTWCLAFTRWHVDEFTRDQLAGWLWKVKSEAPSTRGTRASIKRDADVFLRTYVPSKATRTRPLEDTFDCPLVELGLITEIRSNLYEFERGPKSSLPNEIFLYALLDFWQIVASQQNTLSFEAIHHALGSPGGAFKLSENALVERLEELPSWSKLSFGDTGGRRQVYRSYENSEEVLQVLERYYESSHH
jgi:hypothetical protein